MQCPECGATSIARSHRRGWVENVVLSSLAVYPFRCRACKARFLRRHAKRERADNEAVSRTPTWLTASVWFVVLCLAAGVVVALVVAFAE